MLNAKQVKNLPAIDEVSVASLNPDSKPCDEEGLATLPFFPLASTDCLTPKCPLEFNFSTASLFDLGTVPEAYGPTCCKSERYFIVNTMIIH